MRRIGPQDFIHCKKKSLDTDDFPRLRLFVSPENRYDHETRVIKKHLDMPYTEKETDEATIFNFIAQNIPNKSIKLDSYNLYPFLNSDSMNKVILFTEKHYPGVLFRGLTCNFYDKLLFGTVHSTETEVVEKFQIKTFPTILVYKTYDRNHLMIEPNY